MSVQLGTGGWEDYPALHDGENNEVTGEALWGIMAAYPPPVYNVTKAVFYPTIQGAINDASAGNIINVAAGTYDERIIINKALTLKGATNGVSKKGFVVPPAYAYDPLTQSIIMPSTPLEQAVVQIASDNVTFARLVVHTRILLKWRKIPSHLRVFRCSIMFSVRIQMCPLRMGPKAGLASALLDRILILSNSL
jgi:hypothetical protein